MTKAATRAEKRLWVDPNVIRISKKRPKQRLIEPAVTIRRSGAVDCVYFVRLDNTDAYKIGYTHHLGQRLSAIGAGIPAPVRAVAWVSFLDPDWLGEAEAQAHKLASIYGARIKGEWFNLKNEDIPKIVDGLIEALRDQVMDVSRTGEFPR